MARLSFTVTLCYNLDRRSRKNLGKEEETKFSAWLNDTLNPAAELLSEFRTLNKIESLEDLDRLADKVQTFYDSIRNIIRKNSQSTLKLDDHKGITIQEDTITVDMILAFSAFCLVKSEISKTDFQNVTNFCQYFVTQGSKKYNNKVNLEGTLSYLNEQKCLINDNDNKKKIDISPPDNKILALQKFFTPLDATIEYLKDRVPTPISEKLSAQFENLLLLLKKEATDAVNSSKSLELDELHQAITTKIGQLPSMLDILLTESEILGSNISIYSASERNALITRFEDDVLKSCPNLSVEIKQSLQELVEQTHRSVGLSLQKFSIKNFSNELLKPLDELLVQDNKFPKEVENQLKSLRNILQYETERLFKLGKNTQTIGENLRGAIFQITNRASEFLSEEELSIKQEKEQSLLKIIDRANEIFTARKILDPFEQSINLRDLTILPDLRIELNNLYTILKEEIESCLKKSEPQEKINQRFNSFILELEVLTKTVGNPKLNKEEKLATIEKLRNQVEEQHSIFPEKVVQALRKVIGAAMTSVLLNKLENAIGFFKPATSATALDQKVKSVVKDAKTKLTGPS